MPLKLYKPVKYQYRGKSSALTSILSATKGSLLTVEIEVDPEAESVTGPRGEIVTREQSSFKSTVDVIASEISKQAANSAAEKMRAYLKKGHKYQIGASDSASENIFVKEVGKGTEGTFYGVYEGDNPANTAIRSGIMKKGTRPPWSKIISWMKVKGIGFYGEERKNKLVTVRGYTVTRKLKNGGSTTYNVRRYARLKKVTDEDTIKERALFKIQNAIYYGGSFREPSEKAYGSNWMQGRWTETEGRFDYVAVVVEQIRDDRIPTLLDSASKGIYRAFATWKAGRLERDGKWVEGSAWKRGGRRKIFTSSGGTK